jgi:hypothetical protein
MQTNKPKTYPAPLHLDFTVLRAVEGAIQLNMQAWCDYDPYGGGLDAAERAAVFQTSRSCYIGKKNERFCACF